MKLSFILMLVLWMPFASALPEDSAEERELLLKAREALKTEEYQIALDAYMELLQQNPSHVKALHELARLHATASDPDFFDGQRAVELAVMALDETPSDPAVIDTLAMGYFAQNKFERAIYECLRCSELNPYDPFYDRQLKKFARTWLARLEITHPGRETEEKLKAACYLGRAQYTLGEDEEAVEPLERAYMGLQNNEVCLYLAKVLIRLGNSQRAIEVLQSRGEDLNRDALLLTVLGEAHEGLRDFKAASQSYESAYRLNPEFEGLRLRMGAVYIELNKIVKAVLILKEAQADLDRAQLFAGDEEARILYLLGKAMASAGEQEEGIRHLFEAVCLDMDMPGLERDLIALYIQKFGSSKGLKAYLAKLKHDSVPIFEEVAKDANLDRTGMPAFGDFDGDGDPDLLLSGSWLYENDGKGRFKDVTEAMGLKGLGGDRGIFGDYDNDGDLDLYVIYTGRGEREKLLRNDGKKGFTDVSEAAGNPSDLAPTAGAAFGDVDGDGWLDLFLANGLSQAGMAAGDYTDALFLGRDKGVFEDFSQASGLAGLRARCAAGMVMGDFDSDGDLDILVTHDHLEPNHLLQNNGAGVFSDQAAALGVAGHDSGNRFGNSMGAVFGDLEGDGDLDLIVANRAEPKHIQYADRSQVYLNSGRPEFRFTDQSNRSFVFYSPTHDQPLLADLNNDGKLDLFLTSRGEGRTSRLYLGRGDGTFLDVSWLSGLFRNDLVGCAVADVDLDGDLDLFAGGAELPFLFLNQVTGNHWIQFKLEGKTCNGTGIGARVTIDYGTRSQVREVLGGRSQACQDSMIVHFGLGSHEGKVSVSLQWPNGRSDLLSGLKTNRLHKVVEKR